MIFKGFFIFAVSLVTFSAANLSAQTDDAVSRARIENNSVSAVAAEALKRADAEEAKFLKSSQSLDSSILKLEAAMMRLGKSVKSAGAQIDENGKVVSCTFAFTCPELDTKKLEALRPVVNQVSKDLEKARLDRAVVAKNLRAASEATDSALRTKNSVEQNASKSVKTAELQLAENNRRIKKLEAFQKLSEADLMISGLGEKLSAIERVGDQAVIGAYFQKKMEKLLNSNVLCSAAKACSDNGKAKASAANISSEIFGAKSSPDFSNVKGSPSAPAKAAK